MPLQLIDCAAIQDFKQRIKMYEKKYAEVGKDEGSFIKVVDVGVEVIGYQINGMLHTNL